LFEKTKRAGIALGVMVWVMFGVSRVVIKADCQSAQRSTGRRLEGVVAAQRDIAEGKTRRIDLTLFGGRSSSFCTTEERGDGARRRAALPCWCIRSETAAPSSIQESDCSRFTGSRPLLPA